MLCKVLYKPYKTKRYIMKNTNNKEVAQKMIDILGLKGSPVAVALAKEIPPGIEKGLNSRHCEMVARSRLEGAEFYAAQDQHTCKGGAGVIGLMDLPKNVENGEYYFKLGAFASKDASRITMEKVPRLENQYAASVYSPLGSAKFPPDIVIVIANARQAMQVIQASIYLDGGRIHTDFAGKQSLCADIVANSMKTNSIQVSLGCSGSRKFARIGDDEVIIGVPANMLGKLVDSLDKMFGQK